MFALAEWDQIASDTSPSLTLLAGLREHQMLAMVGLSYRTASVALREKFALAGEGLSAALRALTAHPAVHEACILSTCNRTECYAVIATTEDWRGLMQALFAAQSRADGGEYADSLYWHAGEDAARHLFRVAAGLDSMVLGEAEIVNQLKQASAAARRAGAAGTILQRLTEKALAAQKRARTQARYDGGISVASTAVAACKRAFAELSDVSVMVVGAGDTAELTVHSLVSKGVRRVMVANRTLERAARLTRVAGGTALPLTAFPSRLAEVDLVICCTASPEPVLTRAMVEDAMTARGGRPLLVVDIAVPRDVETAVAEVPTVQLLNIDALCGAARATQEQRQAKLIAADEIIAAEARAFGKWLSCRRAIAVVADLQRQIETLRAEIAATLAAELGAADGAAREMVDARTRELARGILRASLDAMQTCGGGGDAPQQMAMIRRLLELEA